LLFSKIEFSNMEIITSPGKSGEKKKGGRKQWWWICAEKKMRIIWAEADQSLIWDANFYFSQGNLEFEGRI
jgi:hypothetical protein